MEMPPLGEKDFESPQLNVLLVARLVPFKGVDDFLSVAEELAEGPFQFTIVGPKSQHCADLYERVIESQDRGLIRYQGVLAGPSLYEEYQKAHVFFCPSHGEGMARVLIEAGLAGVCPVAYDIVGNRDLLGPGRGLLVPPGDLPAVVAVLERLEENRDELRANAAAYRAHVEAEYNMDVYAQRMDEILENATGRVGPA